MTLSDCAYAGGGGRRDSRRRGHLPGHGGWRVGALRGGRGVAVQAALYGRYQRRALLRHAHQLLRVGGIPQHGLVLSLGPPQRRLHGHHPLPFRGQAALLALARAIHAVALVALEGDLLAVVPAAGAVGRRPRRGRRTRRVHVHLALVLLRIGHANTDYPCQTHSTQHYAATGSALGGWAQQVRGLSEKRLTMCTSPSVVAKATVSRASVIGVSCIGSASQRGKGYAVYERPPSGEMHVRTAV